MGGDIQIAAPPELPPASSSGVLVRVLPIVMSVAILGVMSATVLSGSGVVRSPIFLAFPAMTLASLATAVVAGRGRRWGATIDADRVDYLAHLSDLRRSVAEMTAAQRLSLQRDNPDPETLWTLVGSPRMWERRPADIEFCHVRVGIGNQPFAGRLVVAANPPTQRADPVTVTALRRFVDAYSTVADAPVAIPLRGVASVTIYGDVTGVRGLLRAMICQLAVLHAPDDVAIVGAISDRNSVHWDWLKWLPHNQHPTVADAVGPARMVYSTLAEAQGCLAGAGLTHAVVIADLDQPAELVAMPGVTVLEAGSGGDGVAVTIERGGDAVALARPDRLDPADALNCARRLAASLAGGPRHDGGSSWTTLVGIGDLDSFEPVTLWRSQHRDDRLSVPIGTSLDGTPVTIDIKEPAHNGIGPHGLCIGATGSGKSELLRTVALGMMARNSPELLNLLLIDFKGGATFLDLARTPHVAAVITNLSDEAPLVARMRDALAGEMNRRQQLLRAAGNFVGVAAYEDARRGGAKLAPLPTLFIIVDEFSELLSQHPDFADMFVAIGRLGRSLGMHLLLASQRLDEGRLRGLEAHLSYRVCLKTLSAGESRSVLGTLDAYELPNTPGAGFLRRPTGELTGFRAAYVSGPVRNRAAARAQTAPSVRLFTTHVTGPGAAGGADEIGTAPTVLRAVLDRLSGQGPPAHQVWLPPLAAAPQLDDLLREVGPGPALTAPIGVVDRPFEQCRTPLMVDLSGAAGNVAVVGAPKTGKSTTLRTLITALAATHDPGRVQFYCLDFGGGGLASLNALPHVGAVAGRAEPELVGRMIAELESLVRTREAQRAAAGSVGCADVFLVVDGWATLRHEFAALEEAITALAGQGLSFGVHVVLSASRWAELRPSLKDQIGTRIELRLGEPADSEVDRKRAQQVPLDKPGSGLSRDGLHMVVAAPRLEVVTSSSGVAAPPIPLLPSNIDYYDLVGSADDEVLLGVEERRLRPVGIDFQRHPHLLILGDSECGKSAALRTLCREIVRTNPAARARLFIADFRRSLLGVVESEHLGGYAMSASALSALLPGLLEELRGRLPPPHVTQAQLRARSWWSGPDLYVVVDDYDLVATLAGNPLSVLVEYLPHAMDLGLHLVVARRSGGAARALFEPLLASLRDLGCMGLMLSTRADEGTLLDPVARDRGRRGAASWSPAAVTSNSCRWPGARQHDCTPRRRRGRSGRYPPIVL